MIKNGHCSPRRSCRSPSTPPASAGCSGSRSTRTSRRTASSTSTTPCPPRRRLGAQPRQPLHRRRGQPGRRPAGSEVADPRPRQPLQRHQPQRRRDPLRPRRQAVRRRRRERRTAPTRSRWPTAWARCCGSTPTARSPTDNPFFTRATGANRAIWALGLRNPFTFAFQPGTGRDATSTTSARARGRRSTSASPARTTAGRPSRAPHDADPAGRLRRPAVHLPHHDRRRPDRSASRSPAARSTSRPTPAVPRRYLGDYFFADLGTYGGTGSALDAGTANVDLFATRSARRST